MGEYANYRGSRVKIGTCENMYYLRWEQRHQVTDSETPLFDPKVLAQIRFRFPWPSEDGIAPGQFESAWGRGLTLWNFEQPKDFEHGLVQFQASNGYLVSLPCPEATAGRVLEDGLGQTYTIHRNGYGGPATLVAQAWRDGRLVGIAQCNGCEHLYRLDGGYEEAAAVSIRAQAYREIDTADRNGTEGNREIGRELHTIADRLLGGYALSLVTA